MQATVRKLDLAGQETWRYVGQVLARQPKLVRLEARFNRPDLPFHGLVLKQGDRFLETFYTDRWYNIFEMHDRDNDQLKGWYCNVSLPAQVQTTSDQPPELVVSYVDLALDLLVYPDGRQLVLDEAEFAALALSPRQQAQARAALHALQRRFQK
jgi:hypothetical protein